MAGRRSLLTVFIVLSLSMAVDLPPKQSADGAQPVHRYRALCVPPAPPEDYAVSVSPKGTAVTWPPNTTGHTATFTVANTGLCQDTYNFSYFASGPVTNVTLDKTSAFLMRGASTTVTATYTAGGAGTGTLTLQAYGTDGPAGDQGYYNVTVPRPATVTPHTATAATRAPNAAGYSETFTVQNIQAVSDTITSTCTGFGNVICTGTTPAKVFLAPNGTASVTASYYTGPAGTGTLRFIALATNQAGDTGTFTVPIVVAGVSVTPDSGSTAARVANTGSFKEVFTITNTGAGTKTFTVACSGSSNVTCTGVSGTSVQLVAGASTTDTATYTVGAAGTGKLTLTATAPDASDAGSYRIGVVSSAQLAPAVVLNTVNGGSVSPRELCVTIALGPNAASECGDLRIVHALPTTRTMNKARTPTLLYNSQLAHPYPLVAALVTLPSTAIPDSIEAVLTVSGTVRRRGQWAGSQWTPGSTRRIALSYDGLADATGIYPYTLEVISVYGASRLATDSTGQLLVVNRQASAFGIGWWLAGVEQLNVGTKLWVGGDGSAHQYQPAGTNVWVGPNVDHPDTLKQVVNGGSTYYVRYLPKGVQVWFNAQGQHVYTYNRQGQRTTFSYNQATGVLDSINLAVIDRGTGYIGPSYRFAYTATAPYRLLSITAPFIGALNRRTTITQSAGFITQIQDPDLKSVQFAPVTGVPELIQSRTDRRGTQLTFMYDAGNRMGGSYVSPNANQTSVLQLTTQQSRGLAGVSVDASSAYTLIDGPRTDSADITKVWQDRWSQPTLVEDAHGSQTRLLRGDASWPGLVTEVDHPNGWRVTATYDARGNIASTTDYGFGGYPTTTYQWDQRWDEVTLVKRPERDSIVMAYDPATGNRLWQQDGRGDSTRVTFGYGDGNELVAITPPRTPAESIAYTYVTGNVTQVKTPKGFDTQYTLDDAGRVIQIDTRMDTLVHSPPSCGCWVYQTTRKYYDILDRDSIEVAIGPQIDITIMPETLFVFKFYNANGQLDSLLRWSDPDSAAIGTMRTSWRYDAMGRAVAQIASDGYKDSTIYDLAGNPDTLITRRGHTITMVYDALNRLVSKSLPAVTYPQRSSGIALNPMPPAYPAYTIPAESRTFTYDALGRTLTANDADALVTQSYFLDGRLATDSLWIRTVTGTDFSQHVYGIAYTYDRDGRVTSEHIPHQLAIGGTGDTLAYRYEPQLGSVLTTYDPQGSRYDFGYNARAEMISLTYPAQYRAAWSYDADGQLAADTVRNLGGTAYPRIAVDPVRATHYAYDARGSVVWSGDPQGYKDTLTAKYTGLGHLHNSELIQHGSLLSGYYFQPARYSTSEYFELDALANRSGTITVDTTQNSSNACIGPFGCSWVRDSAAYEHGTGRLLRQYVPTSCGSSCLVWTIASSAYDSAGNIKLVTNPGAVGTSANERVSMYAADGSLRAAHYRWVQMAGGSASFYDHKYTFEEYRYDALGRRIWFRSIKSCNDPQGILTHWEQAECSASLIRRTIWAGDQELAEIQMPGDTTTPTATLENDVAAVDVPVFAANDGGVADRNPYYGHVVYTPGRGLDHPLAVTRYNYTFRSDAFTGQQIARQTPAPFTIMAFWNARGDPSVGAFTNGARLICNPPTSQSACVGVVWLFYFSAYDRNRGITWDNWQGTILEEKRDKSGLAYMRNRYYDPATGRFTQEDPIGLGGGLNLYGFANGDPINYSDPFGLCPICAAAAVILAEAAEGAVVGAVTGAGERILLNRLSGRPTFEGVGKTALEGAAVGAVTAGVGSAIRIARAVGLAKSATEATETAVASRAEAEAAGELHVGSERVEMVDRTTGSFKGYRNPKTGARYRPEPGQDHVNLENDQGGNVHVKFPDQ